MLFLASHGLQTPLSAIRWGCGRLRRMCAQLSGEQTQLVDSIQAQAKLLSDMFNALLLLAKFDDGALEVRLQDIYLRDYLTAPALQDCAGGVSLQVSCDDDARLRIDRTVFDGIMRALVVAVVTGRKGDGPVSVEVTFSHNPSVCILTFAAPLELSLVEEPGREMRESDARMVGGTPGVMLAVASSLATALGGTLEVTEERGATLTLPAPPSVSVLPES